MDLYVFDAYGTLFDVDSAVARYRGDLGERADRLSELWRLKQLEYMWSYALMRRWHDFRALTSASLDTASAMVGGLPDGLRPKLIAAYEELDAYPDVVPALTALRAKGARTAILSNGSVDMLRNATRAAGLGDLLDAVLSVDAVRTYKVCREVYELVEQTFGVQPDAVSFQSSNRWDVAGAASFGFQTVWINRTGKPDEYADLPPGRVVRGLDELVA